MANFVLNSTQMISLRRSEVIAYQIEPYEREEDDEIKTGFSLVVKMNRTYDPDIVFEQAETLGVLQPLVQAFHNAMES